MHMNVIMEYNVFNAKFWQLTEETMLATRNLVPIALIVGSNVGSCSHKHICMRP